MIYFGVHVNLLYKSKRNLLRFFFSWTISWCLADYQASYPLMMLQSCVEPRTVPGWGRNSPCRLSAPPVLSFYRCTVELITNPRVGRASTSGHMYKHLDQWLTASSLASPFLSSFTGLHSSFESGNLSTNGSQISGNTPSTRLSHTVN